MPTPVQHTATNCQHPDCLALQRHGTRPGCACTSCRGVVSGHAAAVAAPAVPQTHARQPRRSCSRCRPGSADTYIAGVQQVPQTAEPHVGVEIELISHQPPSTMLATAGLGPYCYVKGDGSLRGSIARPYTAEVCVLAPESEIADVIARVCHVLRHGAGAGVNRTCGLHVHLDMRARDVDLCYKRLVNVQPLLYAMVPDSRWTVAYCRPVLPAVTLVPVAAISALEAHAQLTSTAQSYGAQAFIAQGMGRTYVTALIQRSAAIPKERYQELWRAEPDLMRYHRWGDRYYGINAAAYARHQTLEVRIHSGTTSAKKINSWIALLLHILQKAVPEPLHTVGACLRALDLPPALAATVRQRLQHLHREDLTRLPPPVDDYAHPVPRFLWPEAEALAHTDTATGQPGGF